MLVDFFSILLVFAEEESLGLWLSPAGLQVS